MQTKNRSFLADRLPQLLFILAPFLLGLYYEATAGIAAIVLVITLCAMGIKQGFLKFNMNSVSIAVTAILAGYIVSILPAVDRGIAVWGIVKYFPVFLFMFWLMQVETERKEALIQMLPFLGIVMTLISGVGSLLPVGKQMFLVDNRLSGFFQYPNTFAIFLLVGLVILLTGKEEKKPGFKLIQAIILAAGILFSGSRTVFMILVVMLIVYALLSRKKAAIFLCGGAVGIFLLLLLISSVAGGRFAVLDRFLRISIFNSSLLGRILYALDSLSAIIRHPFGLGYLGYYFSQGIYQTGVYSTRFIHNDILQVFVDVGWIPGILFVLAVVRSLMNHKLTLQRKLAILALILHCMLDFDLEYTAMWLVLILLMDRGEEAGKCKTFRWKTISILPAFLLMLGLYYMTFVTALSAFGLSESALKIYPWDTFSRIRVLQETETPEEMERAATKILKQNKYVSVAWSGLARAAYGRGDFEKVIEYKRQALLLVPFRYGEFHEYYEMLKVGIEKYTEAGDEASAAICSAEIEHIDEMLDTINKRTSYLGWKLDEKPLTELQRY